MPYPKRQPHERQRNKAYTSWTDEEWTVWEWWASKQGKPVRAVMRAALGVQMTSLQKLYEIEQGLTKKKRRRDHG